MNEVRRIGHYEAVVPIGTGGMATVYLAFTPVADSVAREVALKLVHPHLRESEATANTLIEEAKLAARIRHPNVVSVREVGQDAQGIYLVMDYVEGTTLSKLVRASGTLPLPIAARILCEALRGLHAAHELSDDAGAPLELVHRDFSPQNVLVGVDGVTRLTDFGIAKAASRSGVTSTGVVKGKVGYLSPEQALGKPLDRRSDIWAAGVVAWELLAGKRLYEPDGDLVAAIMRVVSETPPKLRTVRPELSPLLEQIVATALSIDPRRRWPSADEMARALAEAFRSEGGVAETEEVGAWVKARVGDELDERRERYRSLVAARLGTQPIARPKRRGLAIALGSAALVSLGVAAWLFAKPPPSPTLATVPPAPSEPAVANVVTPVSEPAAPTPDVPASVDAGVTETTATLPARRVQRARPATTPRMPGPGPNPYRKP